MFRMNGPGPGGGENFYEKNLAALRSIQPDFLNQVLRLASDEQVKVGYSQSGHPVPIIQGKPIHSMENPVEEGCRILPPDLLNGKQRRILIIGYGFGYHVDPFLEKGFSPMVYVSSPSTFRLAMEYRDLTRILPYLTFYCGEQYPDLPRRTEVLAHSVLESLYPQHVARIKAKIIKDYPAHTDTIEEGVYYGVYGNVSCLKNPLDMMIYHQVLFNVRPTLIIELGTCRGGSALWFADKLRRLGGDRRIHTYDVIDETAPEVHWDPLVTFHMGGWQAFDPSLIRPDDRVLIVEDSSHTYENTLQVLRHFAPFVSPNSYFIIEDGATTLSNPSFHGGPVRAIEEFMGMNSSFEMDRELEFMYGSKNTNCLKGFLRKKT